MDQIITLLSNLFSLTKVASVTLPGLLAAGGLTMILWPAAPVDVIPAVVQVSPAFPPPNDAATPACEVQHWAVDNVLAWMEIQAANPPAQTASPTSPPAPGIEDLGYTHPSAVPPNPLTQKALQQILEIEQKTQNLTVTESRKRAILEQFVLDFEGQSLAVCADVEKSWSGQDELAIQQLTTDIENLEKQRTAAQDSYLASLKANNRALSLQFQAEMKEVQGQIEKKRKDVIEANQKKRERERRAAELVKEQELIKARLGDPGRLRPRIGFDLFVTGLINHLVGFILLSLAAAMMVTAFDRAIFGFVFEDLFDGF